MNCIWEDIPNTLDASGRRRVRCVKCGVVLNPTPHPHERIYRQCKRLPEAGVGDHLKAIIAELAVVPKDKCGCAEMIARMYAWGIGGCREHRQEIVEHLQTAYSGLSWADVARAAAGAVTSGLYRSINPLDVCGSLVDEAIRRAEATLRQNPS